jgi:N-acetylglucosaminyldiphosphoundecaprenol N-acetyl-beta-D-mannosaminyltransferase
VGLGAPKQEQWILEHRSKFEARGNIVVMGVGGLFDFWAGAETRAPVWIQNSGLEWLWRLVTFPRKNSKKAMASLNFFKQLLFPQARSQR